MPKLKTHKGAAKRFKKSGTGKVKRQKEGKKKKGKIFKQVPAAGTTGAPGTTVSVKAGK